MASTGQIATGSVNTNLHSFAESQFSWERESSNFVMERLPGHAPWHAWSNLGYTNEDGNIRKVNLLVFSPRGFSLVQIKNWSGVITGDVSYWHRKFDDRRSTEDNHRRVVNQKFKFLKGLSGRHRAFGKSQCPSIEALVLLGEDCPRFEIMGPGPAADLSTRIRQLRKSYPKLFPTNLDLGNPDYYWTLNHG